MSKKETVKRVSDRRDAALFKVLKPQWRRCFWMRPFGHVRDGRTSQDLYGSAGYSAVCLHCGKPKYLPYDDVKAQEAHASIADRYPIARNVPKAARVA